MSFLDDLLRPQKPPSEELLTKAVASYFEQHGATLLEKFILSEEGVAKIADKLISHDSCMEKLVNKLISQDYCIEKLADKIVSQESSAEKLRSTLLTDAFRRQVLNLDGYVSKEEAEQFRSELNETRSEAEEMGKKKKKLEEQVATLKEELKQEKDKAQKEVERAEAEARKEVERKAQEIKLVKTEAQRFYEEKEREVRELRQGKDLAETSLTQARKDLATQKNKIDSLERDNNALKEDLSKAQKQQAKVEKQCQQAEARAQHYENTYKGPEDLYQAYKELSPELRSSLRGIIGSPQEACSFLGCLTQRKQVEELWEFASYELNNQRGSEKERQTLVALFTFYLQQAQQGQDKYILIAPAQGAPYDERFMERSSNSRQQGVVGRLLLPGFKLASMGKVVQRALVELQEE